MKITQRHLALIAMIAFLVNVMVPFFAVYSIPQAQITQSQEEASQEMASLFGDKILICTLEGFKWVSLEDLQSGKEKPKQHPGYECALCYIAAHGMKSLTVTHAAAPIDLAAIALPSGALFPETLASRGRIHSGTLGSRAPPPTITA